MALSSGGSELISDVLDTNVVGCAGWVEWMMTAACVYGKAEYNSFLIWISLSFGKPVKISHK